MKRTVVCIVAVFIVLVCNRLASAQHAAVLTQEREGSAAVYLSENNRFAYIIDGGKKGGLSKPRLDGKAVLQALLDRGYRNLVITCSHPHDDHAAGLREIMKSDANIEKFEKLYFVDSGYPDKESFFSFFKQNHPTFPADRVIYESAMERNAFSKISHAGDGVHVSNFVYDPEPKAAIHGHAIITHITLEKNGKKIFMVDFDDPDSKLVAKWAQWAEQDPASRRPDVVIVPHHCSDSTDIDPLLNASIRPRSCIITVNPRNRYVHPGAVTFQKWIQAIGLENVHITGVSENVSVSEAGLRPIVDRSVFDKTNTSIIEPNLAEVEKEIDELQPKSANGTLTSTERERYQTLRDRQLAFRAVKRMYAERSQVPRVISTPPPAITPKPYGSVCEICGKPAYGRCSIRNIYVCNEHRTFQRGNQIITCPH